MAKRDSKQLQSNIEQDRTVDRNQFNNERIGAGQNVGNIAPFVAQGREYLSGAYQNMPGIGAPGNVSTGRMGDVYNKFGEIADTGGYSEGTRASILENVGGLKQIGASGGYDAQSTARARGLGGFEKIQNEGGLDPAVQNRMRGMGGYEEFAATGGLSGTDRANIRAKAISPISSYASGTRDELDRRRTLQNNYAPGFDAANRALSRDTSRAIADTSLNAELGIIDRVNQGRLAGLGGMTGTESNLQGLRTDNILGATQGIAGAEQSMVANRTGNQLRGLESASQIESDLSSRIAQLRLQGMSGQQASAQAIAETEGRNIDRGMNAEQFNMGQRNAGLQGMGSLYGSDINQMQAERDRQLGLMGQGTQANQGYYGLEVPLANRPSGWGNAMGYLGTAAGIAGSYFGGGNKGTTATGTPNPGVYYPGMGGQYPGASNPYPPPTSIIQEIDPRTGRPYQSRGYF